MHSFITPRREKAVAIELQWLLFAFLFIVMVMAVITLGLNSAISRNAKELETLTQKHLTLQAQKDEVTQEMARLQVLEALRESVSISNRLTKENVKNFFDLVPEGIVLESVEIEENRLILLGRTKSKKYFHQTFQRALHSLSPQSKTTFSKLKKGGYRFKNVTLLEVDK